MKRLILLFMIMSVCGCAAVDAYFMTPFDPNEYQLITQIRVDATRAKDECADVAISKVNSVRITQETELFLAYSEYLKHNQDSTKAAVELHEIAQGLSSKYIKGESVSALFCKLKFEGVEKSASIMQKTLGSRPR
jgi:hypothetical protein